MTEPVVDPAVVIVDPHHHLWGPRPRAVPSVYLVDDLHTDTGDGHNVQATVFVECSTAYRTEGPREFRQVGETAFVADAARDSRRRPGQAAIAAIVGACDLTIGRALSDVLDAHEQAGDGLFRGIRHRLAYDPTGSARTSANEDNIEGLMSTDAFREGVRTLGERGLSFDAWLYHVQLMELVDLARAVPGTPIVLDHIGAPLGVGVYAGRRAEIHETWRAALVELSSCPNVVVKVGGIGMPAYGSGYDTRATPPSSDEIVEDWGDALRFVINTFGASRCMFESNFPVDKISFPYRTMWNAYKKVAAGYSDPERHDLFRGTASRFYKL